MPNVVTAVGIAVLALCTIGAGCAGDDGGRTSNVGATGTPAGTTNNGVPGGGAPPTTMPPLGTDAGGVAPPFGGTGGVSGLTVDAGLGGMPGTNPPPIGVPTTGGTGGTGALSGTGGMTAGSGMTAGTGGMGATGGTAGPGSIMRGGDPTSASASTKGPYQVMSYTDGFPVNLYLTGTIWYPTDAMPPFGAVAVCPGFVSPQSSIMSWGPFLASHGIVVITIDTLTPLDVVDQRAEELMDALASVKSENSRAGSPLNNKIDTMRMGVMGWSMGGGGSWLAATAHPELRTAVTFAAHIATALNQDVTTNRVPTLMFAGEYDDLILGGAMSQPVYDQMPASTPKMVWEVAGAGHDVANSPSGTGGAIGRYGLSWQKVFLEGDMRYRKFLLEMPPNSSDFKSNVK